MTDEVKQFILSKKLLPERKGAVVKSDQDLRRRREELELHYQEQQYEQELRKKDVEIEELKTDRALKERVARFVFDLLLIETGLVFIVLFFQGLRPYGFHLNDTTLNIFLPATILQISAMAIIITKYLFSRKSTDS